MSTTAPTSAGASGLDAQDVDLWPLHTTIQILPVLLGWIDKETPVIGMEMTPELEGALMIWLADYDHLSDSELDEPYFEAGPGPLDAALIRAARRARESKR